MPLTDTAIRKAKSAEKAYKLPDEKGLYLFISVPGGKLRRFNYRHEGKQKTRSFGAYPDVPLIRAREKRDEARRLLADGVDPGEHRKVLKAAKVALRQRRLSRIIVRCLRLGGASGNRSGLIVRSAWRF